VGRIRRGGYIIEWFIGDHVPRHVHIYDSRGRFVGRLDTQKMKGIEDWKPDRKLVTVIKSLKREGRL
jgi:hypothetical protein